MFWIISRNNINLRPSYFKNMRISTISVLFLLLVTACSRDKHNFKIRVTVTGSDKGTLYLAQRTIAGTVPVDSAMPDKSGTYILKGLVREPDFYIVYHVPKHYINLIVSPGDDFKVRTDAAGFENNYFVEGSKDSRLIQKMVSMQAKTLVRITEISTAYENGVGQPGFEKLKARIDSTYKRIVSEHKNFSIKLIEENPHSLASLMALYQQLGRDIPVFDYKTDFKYYQQVDSNLASLYPGSDAVKDLDRKVTELKNLIHLEVGSLAPAITMPDAKGNMQSLQSLKGRYVLLVFWASWSSQSCEDVKKLIPLYNEYTGKGLEFYMVSLDRSRESWIKRCNELHTMGIQVSDLKYWDSPVVDEYRINQLPVFYLLDRNGMILKKEITMEELPDILAGALGKR
jgi:hypothetical protein